VSPARWPVGLALALGLAACQAMPVQLSRAADPALATEARSISSGNGELFARRVSPAEPAISLILLHGGPGMASSYLSDLEALADAGIEIISYDQRGSGASTRPDPGWGMEAYQADLERVIRSMATAPVHLFGHSWGGLLAMTYAAKHPAEIESLVLFGSAPPTHAALERAEASFLERVSGLQQSGVIGPPPALAVDYLSWVLPAYFANPLFKPPEALASLPIESEVNRQTWRALSDFDFRTEIGRLELPVLFIYGEADPFGRSMAESSLAALSSAQVNQVWLPACGHFWQECPEQVYPVIEQFLTQQAAVP